MKYNQPPGMAEGAPYIDGDRSSGIKGSIVPAAAIEHPQRELNHLIDFAGLTPAIDDLEQVRKAIEALIAAATGGGDTSQFLLVSQARARLPIFPEISTADGRINVSSPGAGTVLVPPAVSFQHRGIFPVNTSSYDEPSRTFATLANKTYHLRWNPVDGFGLKDVANPAYNPLAKAESAIDFDSTYDDMLVSRVVTNAGNVATITGLMNKNVMTANGYGASAPLGAAGYDPVNPSLLWEVGIDPNTVTRFETQFINWSRRPETYITALGSLRTASPVTELTLGVRPLSRYAVAVWAHGDHGHSTAWAARA